MSSNSTVENNVSDGVKMNTYFHAKTNNYFNLSETSNECFECKNCNKKYKSRTGLRQHNQYCMPITEPTISDDDMIQNMREEIQKEFILNQYMELRTFIAEQYSIKEFNQVSEIETPIELEIISCECCSYSTNNKWAYQSHVKSKRHLDLSNPHTDNIYHECKNCTKKFKSRTGLWKHNHDCTPIPATDTLKQLREEILTECKNKFKGLKPIIIDMINDVNDPPKRMWMSRIKLHQIYRASGMSLSNFWEELERAEYNNMVSMTGSRNYNRINLYYMATALVSDHLFYS